MQLAELGPTQWRWYRRMIGGKWSLWVSWFVGDMWIQGWEPPEQFAVFVTREIDGRQERMKASNEKTVWIGFSGDKPHCVESMLDGPHVCAYATKREASRHYQDVRKAKLVFEPQFSGNSGDNESG